MFNWFKRLGIRNKLLLSYAAILLISSVALVVNVNGTLALGTTAVVLAGETEIAAHLHEFQSHLAEVNQAERDYLLSGDASFLEIREEAEHESAEHLQLAINAVAAEQRQNLVHLQEELGHGESFEQVIAFYEAGRHDEATELFIETSAEHSEEIEELVHGVLDVSSELLDESVKEARETADSQLTTSAIGMVAAVAVAGAIALFLAGNITGPIAKLRELADKISMGDLDVQNTVNAKDEIGDLSESFDRMVTAVRFLSTDNDEQGSEA